MTPKERVLQEFPQAESAKDGIWAGKFYDYAVFTHQAKTGRGGYLIGEGESARAAWADAASRLARKPKEK